MKNYISQYFYIIGTQKKYLFNLLILFFISAFLDLIGIGLIGSFFAQINPTDSGWLSQYIFQFEEIVGKDNVLNMIGLIIIFIFIFKAVLSYWVQKNIVTFSANQLSILRNKLMDTYQHASYQFYLKHNKSELIQSMQEYTISFISGTLTPSLLLVMSIITTTVLFILLLNVNVFLVISMSFIIGGSMFLYYRLIRNILLKIGKNSNKSSQIVIQAINESMTGFKEIRVLGKELYFYDLVTSNTIIQAQSNIKQQVFQIIPRYAIELIVVIFIISFSLIKIHNNNIQTLLPTLSMLGIAALRLMPAALQIFSSLTQMRFSHYAMVELYKDLEETENMHHMWNVDLKKKQSDLMFSEIELRDVSYYYPSTNHTVIDSLSIRIKKGESIGLIGKSGSGKTTLIDIVLGFLEPQKGQVLVDNKLLNQDLRSWLNRLAYIPQTVFLTDDTLRNNIALGVNEKEINEKKVINALSMAQMKGFVQQLPDGLDTVVGDNGIKLSGGQRQRVALARAIYHDREIIVMDEATSALDHETEKAVTQAVKNLKNDRTFIIIAHRLVTLKYCDIIYKLDKGKIVDQGSYEYFAQLE